MEQEFIDVFNKLEKVGKKPGKDQAKLRGEEFEKLINNVFDFEEKLIQRSYRINKGVLEQIDGAIKIDNRILLLEVKWVESGLAASELYSFIGKVDNKLDGTLGVFISREELSESFVTALNKGRRQRVLVIHGEDIDELFKLNVTISEYLTEVIHQISIRNDSHYSVKKYLMNLQAPKKVQKATNKLKGEANRYIKEHILSGESLTMPEFSLTYKDLSKSIKKIVFEFVVEQYYSFYQTLFNQTKTNADILHNVHLFIEMFQNELWEDKVEIELVKKYYSTLIHSSLSFYSRDIFSKFFSNYYGNLPRADRATIEKKLIDKMDDIKGDYYSENEITEIINPIWHLLQKATRENLIGTYLEFFISTRVKSYPQMLFAKKLLDDKEITKEEIIKWVVDKITDDFELYKKMDFYQSYDSLAEKHLNLAKYFNLHPANWVKYISDLLQKKK